MRDPPLCVSLIKFSRRAFSLSVLVRWHGWNTMPKSRLDGEMEENNTPHLYNQTIDDCICVKVVKSCSSESLRVIKKHN